MQADLDTVLHVSLFSSIIIFRNGDFLDFSTFPRTLFLAVKNSSIGDLVTHSLTHSVSNPSFDFERLLRDYPEQSRAEQSRAIALQ